MTKPINDFSDAKVGDKVTCTVAGHGEIVNVYNLSEYSFPIECQFEDHLDEDGSIMEFYNHDGKENKEDKHPRLFKGHVEFPDPIPVKKGEEDHVH